MAIRHSWPTCYIFYFLIFTWFLYLISINFWVEIQSLICFIFHSRWAYNLFWSLFLSWCINKPRISWISNGSTRFIVLIIDDGQIIQFILHLFVFLLFNWTGYFFLCSCVVALIDFIRMWCIMIQEWFLSRGNILLHVFIISWWLYCNKLLLYRQPLIYLNFIYIVNTRYSENLG